MKDLILLCHRIPYPPNKGDKIRSYHLARYLSRYYNIHLASYIDDPRDRIHESAMAEMCKSYCLLNLNPFHARLRCLGALIQGKPLGLSYYKSRQLQTWVSSAIEKYDPKVILCVSSVMAQYAMAENSRQVVRIIDFVDVDSDKWAQYGAHEKGIMKWVYSYEARMLSKWEYKVASEFDRSYFVSRSEANLFSSRHPDLKGKISYFSNGVDIDYFSRQGAFSNPYGNRSRVIVFTGAMDYWANVDAVHWFSTHIMPELYRRHADVMFYIVGSNPDRRVVELSHFPYIEVTGAVDDVRPYLAHAMLAVAPMRIARGVQNKVLEAMAMELPVVVSQQGYEGIDAAEGQEIIVANEVSDWIESIHELLEDQTLRSRMGSMARNHVTGNYNWDINLSRLKSSIDKLSGS